MTSRLVAATLASLLMVCSAQAAGFRVTISPGANDVPLAMPKPQQPAGASDNADVVWQAAWQDLALSGYFEMLDPDAYIEQGKGVEPGTFSFDDWTHIDTNVLVKTRVLPAGDTSCDPSGVKMCADVFVYYVISGETLAKKRFRAEPKLARHLGHHVADAVLKATTGKPGFVGATLAAVGNQQGNKELFVMDLDGKSVKPVTRNGSINLSPAFSADGRYVAWTSYKRGNPDLYVKDLVTGRARVVSNRRGINASPAFSPDGRRLALARSNDGDSDIVLIDVKTGKDVKQITTGGGIDVSPDFSPDGSAIAYASERSGGSQIYQYNLATGQNKRLSFVGDFNSDPVYSPDGKKLAFVGRHPGSFDIFVLDIERNQVVAITENMGDNEDPRWSPDGRYLVFSSTRTGRSEIWLSTADGRHQTQLTRTGGWTQPTWAPVGK